VVNFASKSEEIKIKANTCKFLGLNYEQQCFI